MKKTIVALLALPLIFVACSDKGLDRSLDGTWVGEVETSDLTVLNAIGQGQKTSDKAIKETLIYKIDGKNVETYRSKNYQTMNNEVEVEVGSYHKSKDVINFSIDRHSCVKAELTNPRPLSRKITYKFSSDMNTLTMTFGPNKNVDFKRLDSDESHSMNQILGNATTGCFAVGSNGSGNSSFKPGAIEKPKSDDVTEKVDEIQDQANKELKQDTTSDETQTTDDSAKSDDTKSQELVD